MGIVHQRNVERHWCPLWEYSLCNTRADRSLRDSHGISSRGQRLRRKQNIEKKKKQLAKTLDYDCSSWYQKRFGNTLCRLPWTIPMIAWSDHGADKFHEIIIQNFEWNGKVLPCLNENPYVFSHSYKLFGVSFTNIQWTNAE